MTLRLDEGTGRQLRDLSEATGRSQQQLVHEAVREFLDRTDQASRQRLDQWRQVVRAGRVCAPKKPIPGATWASWDEPPRPNPEADARWQAMIDAGQVDVATQPFQADAGVLMTAPPGGVMALLDRDDRF